jgi:glycine/D-amino acid oxidase-like deaminating enzyme
MGADRAATEETRVPEALPPSLYAETAVPAGTWPPLAGEASVDVAVVGGGFTGLSAALHLAEQGASVAVLEANEPGWGASGRNGGQVNPGLKPDPEEVERDYGPDLGRRMVAMSYDAPNVVFDLIRRHQIQCEALQSGTLRAAPNARVLAGVRRTAEQCIARGMPVEVLDAAAMRAAVGNARYAGALIDRRGGQVHPLRYARGLAAAAARAGARVHGGTPVTGLARGAQGWEVRTERGVLRAGQVLLATNGYTDGLWPGLARTVVPMFSAIVASKPLPEALAARIMPGRPVLYEMGHITVYYRLDAENRLLMGGRGPQRALSRPEELRYLIAYAERLWPEVRGIGWTHAWSGRVAVTTDHYPHIHEPAPGLYACLGYNGRGVAMATAMGPQLARRIMGRGQAEIDMPVSPIRPIPLHRFWKLGVAARVASGRVRDALGL